MRRTLIAVVGALVLAGASSFAHAQVWADVEGRIQYAYYTNDARALNGVLAFLKPKAVEGESESGGEDVSMRAYFRALTHYRLAQVLISTKKSEARGAIGDCGDEVDRAVDALPRV